MSKIRNQASGSGSEKRRGRERGPNPRIVVVSGRNPKTLASMTFSLPRIYTRRRPGTTYIREELTWPLRVNLCQPLPSQRPLPR